MSFERTVMAVIAKMDLIVSYLTADLWFVPSLIVLMIVVALILWQSF